jgi:hypothetical protein
VIGSEQEEEEVVLAEIEVGYTEWPKKMYTHFDMKNITL